MIVSWNWLKDYVAPDVTAEEVAHRLTMAGLNLEEIVARDGDLAIDLEVTSNRPDCLGHIGVAREIAVLYNRPLTLPEAAPPASAATAASATSVAIECPDLCPRYYARVLRGVKVGPSPGWLRQRLEVLGIASINNVVDVTNYVLMECGQPLHAFDFDKLQKGRIVVRRARPGEKIVAIDQREYELDAQMCVIADAARPVAIGGVMGGLDTEIGHGTANVLIETAEFAPLSIRNTARRLNLHSDSSYRFERRVDPAGLDWASRRCCQLLLDVAGGELLDGAVIAGTSTVEPPSVVTLRFGQLKRMLGIEIPVDEAIRILCELGLKQQGQPIVVQPSRLSNAGSEARAGETPAPQGETPASQGETPAPQGGIVAAAFLPPSWRRDLTREADLIEEVARIHGYEEIPADVPVPLMLSSRTRSDRVAATVRDVLTAAGLYEAITMSFVSDALRELFTPHGDLPPLKVEHSSRKQENILRQSLVPSLLESRRENERHGTPNAELFEIAHVYLQAAPGAAAAETEPKVIALVSGRPLADVKGLLAALVGRLNARAEFEMRPADCGAGVSPARLLNPTAGSRDGCTTSEGSRDGRTTSEGSRDGRTTTAGVPQFAAGRGGKILLNGRRWGWLGELDRSVTDKLDLRDAVTVAEVDFAALEAAAELTPSFAALPQFPAIERDLNFVLAEQVTWSDLSQAVRAAAGPLLEAISFGGQYRGKQIASDRKSYVVRLSYRAGDRTLKAEEVDAAVQQVVSACEERLGAALR